MKTPARDIARMLGLRFEELVEQLEKRGVYIGSDTALLDAKRIAKLVNQGTPRRSRGGGRAKGDRADDRETDTASLLERAALDIEGQNTSEVSSERRRLGQLLREAATELKRSPSSAHISIMQDTWTRLDNELVELHSRSEHYSRLRAKVDQVQAEAVDGTLEFVQEEIRRVFQARSQRVLADFDRHDGVARPALDGWNRVTAHVTEALIRDSGVGSTAPLERRQNALRKLSLPERLIAVHFNKADLESAVLVLATHAERRFEQHWLRARMAVATGLAAADRRTRVELPDLSVGLEIPLETSTMLGGTAALAGVFATAVLAAGWHTIAWTLASLTAPLAAVLGVFYVGLRYVKYEEEHAEQRGIIATQLVAALERLRVSVEGELGPELRRRSKTLATQLQRETARGALAFNSRREFWAVLEILERTHHSLGSALRAPTGAAAAVSPRRLHAEALERFGQGDTAGAAFLGSTAFEAALIRWGRDHGLVAGARREGLLLELVDGLHARGTIDSTTRSALHELRRMRNVVIHDLPSLLKRAKHSEHVEEFLASIERHLPLGGG